MKEQAHEILSTLSGNNGSIAVASGTLAAGGMSLLAQVQSWIGILAVAAGFVLSCVLIAKNLREMRYSKEKHARYTGDGHLDLIKRPFKNHLIDASVSQSPEFKHQVKWTMPGDEKDSTSR